MERNYDAIFILSSKLKEDEVKTICEDLKNIIESNNVKILDTIVQTRKLAYPIKKETKGTYLIYKFSAQPQVISNIKDAIKHRDEILRSSFIRKE